MAILATNRATSATATDAIIYTTGAFTPNPLSLLVAYFSSEHALSTNPGVPVISDTGAGLTWFSIKDLLYVTTGVNRARLSLWAAMTRNSPPSMTVSADYQGVTSVGAEWSVFDVTGTDVAQGVTQTFVQTVTSTADPSTNTTVSITLSAAGNSNNLPFMCTSHAANETTNPRASWTELEDASHATPPFGVESQYRSDAFETTASSSWTTSVVTFGAVAWELKANTIFNRFNNYMFPDVASGVSTGEKIK